MKKIISSKSYLNIDISRPSKIKLGLTALFSLHSSKNKNRAVRKIGPYLLYKKIIKENAFNPYFIGIYKRDNKRYFIKTWKGKIKDYHYQALVNEVLVNKVLYNKLLSGKIRTPKIIEFFLTKNSLSVVYEYIEGKSLLSYSLIEQTKILSSVIKCFKIISSKSFNKKYLNDLEKKGSIFYLNSLSFITLISLISSLKNWKVIIKGYFKALKHYSSIKKSYLTINHCDLYPENILISKDKYYIIDCGRLSLTIPEYDLTFISLNPAFSKLYKNISTQLGIFDNDFLKIYLSIQNIKFRDPKSGNFNYLNYLQEAI